MKITRIKEKNRLHTFKDSTGKLIGEKDLTDSYQRRFFFMIKKNYLHEKNSFFS